MTTGARDVRITMDDGVELAAALYLPSGDKGPQPCLLEALPYRKDDLTSSYAPDYIRFRDEYDYAVCRLDVRGTGSSGGDATDEYPEAEQRDLATVMTWLADQDWCDGSIGMFGTSYSGFNSLQMACERPPELKAIVAIYATDDRLTDDVHYRGGALKFVDLVDYNHYMTAMNALPPVPAVWGDGWREEWRRRIATNEPWLLTWMREQRDGAYWRHGSVRPGYDRIACPTMIIVGWADGYRNASYRLIERLRDQGVPHRMLAGPWAHAATENSLPGPRIDSMPDMVAWWDRWLRGIDNGVDDGLGDGQDSRSASPAMTIFVRSSTRPAPDLDTHAGEWIREEWPSPRVAAHRLALDGRRPYAVNPAVGTAAWIDCAGHLPWGQSADLRYDDAASLTWDFDAGGITVMGQPRVRVTVTSDRPVASLVVKLADVFDDKTSALVSRGSLNLTRRHGQASPEPLVPGQEYQVEVELDACAYRFDPGQTMRVSVAGSDWPNTAAPPEPVVLTVLGGELMLPRWTGPSPFDAPVLAAPAAGDAVERAEGVTWQVEHDVLSRETRAVVDHGSTYEVFHGGEATERYSGRVTVDRTTFRQTARATTRLDIAWPDVRVSSKATLDLVADHEAYDVTIDLVVREGDDVIGERHWHERFGRDLA